MSKFYKLSISCILLLCMFVLYDCSHKIDVCEISLINNSLSKTIDSINYTYIFKNESHQEVYMKCDIYLTYENKCKTYSTSYYLKKYLNDVFIGKNYLTSNDTIYFVKYYSLVENERCDYNMIPYFCKGYLTLIEMTDNEKIYYGKPCNIGVDFEAFYKIENDFIITSIYTDSISLDINSIKNYQLKSNIDFFKYPFKEISYVY